MKHFSPVKPLCALAAVPFFAVAFSAALPVMEMPAAQAQSRGQSQSRPLSRDTLPAAGGTIRVLPKFHASTQLEYQGKVIAVDPVLFGSWTKKADLILVTHSHGDHLDLPAIAKLLKSGTTIVAPASVMPTIKTIRAAGRALQTIAITPGTSVNYRFDAGSANSNSPQNLSVRIEAVPMYNIERGPAPGQKYHPREKKWAGYVLTLGGKRLYFAGDTEAIPEMKALKKIDAAFLPMNLPYTMTPEEAAVAARAFRPRVVYPYHFRYPFNKANDHVRRFTNSLRGSRITVKELDWYPRAGIQKFLAASGG